MSFRGPRAGWLAVAAAVVLSACKAHHAALPLRPAQLSGRVLQFPSGLRVVVEPEPGSKRVAFALLVGAGGAQDPPGREGLAHLVEHLLFRSRPNGRLTAWEEFDFAGTASSGSPFVSAFTSSEATVIAGVAPSSRAPVVLPLLGALASRPLQGVDDATLDVERNVVRREPWDEDPHAGGAVGAAVVASVLPRGFPGHRPVVGTDASLRAIARADLELFVAEHYQPKNAVLALVGDVRVEAVEPLLRASFPPAWLTATPAVAPGRRTGAIDAGCPTRPGPPSGTSSRRACRDGCSSSPGRCPASRSPSGR